MQYDRKDWEAQRMVLHGSRHSGAPSGRFSLARDQLFLWLAFALVTGVLQLALGRSLRLGFSIFRWGWESRDLIWRVPMGYILVFAPAAALLVGGTLLLGERLSLRTTLWVWCTLLAFSLLLLFPQINGYASLVLAAGVALPLSARLAGAERLVRGLGRALAVAGVAAVMATAVWLPRQRASQEASLLAAAPVAPKGAPNVLLIILDTVRADYMSLYGATEETTPNLVRWAERGTVFDQAYSTAPWTTPSHASLFTGKYPSVHHASYTTALADEHRTVAEVLRDRGWATGGFTANYVATRYESGLSQGFKGYQDFKNTLEEVLKSTTITQADNLQLFWNAYRNGLGLRMATKRFLSSDFAPHFTENAHDEKSAEEVRTQFTQWVDALPKSRPFFAFLNFFDAHSPYRPPQPYYSMFRQPPLVVDRYRGGIRYIDDQLDSLLRDLERRGVLENTIVKITSDHGEQFGEHDHQAHGNSLYGQVLRVPLMVMYPRQVPSGHRVAAQVTGADVAATLLDLASVPRDSAIEGVSLAPLWADSAARGRDVVAEVDQNMRPRLNFKNSLGPMKALVDDSLHIIRDGAGVIEVYRYRSDPQESVDLVAAMHDSTRYADILRHVVVRRALVWPAPRPRAPVVTDADDDRQ